MEALVCSYCKKRLPVTSFTESRRNNCGNTCRKCVNEHQAQRMEAKKQHSDKLKKDGFFDYNDRKNY